MSGIDYLLLIAFNIGIGALIYILLTLRLSNKMYSYGKTHFEDEIRALVLDFYKESESYLVKLESKINQYKNLQQKQSELQLAWSDEDIAKLLSLADAVGKFGMENIEAALSPAPRKTSRKKSTAKKNTAKKKTAAAKTRKRNSKSKIIEFEKSDPVDLPVPDLDHIADKVEIGTTPSALSQTVDTTLDLAGRSLDDPAALPETPGPQPVTEKEEAESQEPGAMVRFLAKLGQSVSKTITGNDIESPAPVDSGESRFNEMMAESLPPTPQKKDEELYKLLRENQPAPEARQKSAATPPPEPSPTTGKQNEIDAGKLGEDLQRLVAQLQGTLNSAPEPGSKEDKVTISKAAIAPDPKPPAPEPPNEAEILAGLEGISAKKDRILYLRDYGFSNEQIALQLGLNQTEVDLTVRLFAPKA